MTSGVPACETVTTRPRLPRATWRRSQSHVDGVTVAWRRADAIDANLKFGNGQKQTLSHHCLNLGHATRRQDRREVERLDEAHMIGADDFGFRRWFSGLLDVVVAEAEQPRSDASHGYREETAATAGSRRQTRR